MDAGTIGGAIASLNAAVDIAKTMIGLRDASLMQSKAIELNGAILNALNEAIAARQAEAAQIEKIGALEKELTGLKAWGAEKQDYELNDIGSGALAYMLKPEARGTSPPHWLCQNCYEQGKKRIFQPNGDMPGRYFIFKCPGCSGTLRTREHAPKWID